MADFKPDWCFGPQVALLEIICDRLNIDASVLKSLLDGSMPFNDKICSQIDTGISVVFWKNLEEIYRSGLANGLTDLTAEFMKDWMPQEP